MENKRSAKREAPRKSEPRPPDRTSERPPERAPQSETFPTAPESRLPPDRVQRNLLTMGLVVVLAVVVGLVLGVFIIQRRETVQIKAPTPTANPSANPAAQRFLRARR